MKPFTDGVVNALRCMLIFFICMVWFGGLLALIALVFFGWGKAKAAVLWRQSSFVTLLHELR